MHRAPRLLLPAALLLALLPACGRILTDAATRLSAEITDEAAALRSSGDLERTFEHRPVGSPEGVSGDYRIEFVARASDPAGKRVLLVGDSYSGPTRYHTTAHSLAVLVERDFRVPHQAGEPTRVTLQKRGDEIWITDVR